MSDDLLDLIEEPGGRSASEANVWNVLAQILIPLVILITFVAVGLIRTAGEYVKIEKGINQITQRHLNVCQASGNAACTPQRNQAWALNQWEVLLLALDDAIQQQRHKLGFDKFPDASNVHLNGETLDDPDFRRLTNEVAQQLDDSWQARQAYVIALYKTALNSTRSPDSAALAPLQDQLTSPEFFADLNQAMGAPQRGNPKDFALAAEVMDPSLVVREVRQHFLSRAVAECNSMRDDLSRLQLDAIRRIFTALQSLPDELTGPDRESAKSMLETGISQDERTRRAKAFYRQFTDGLRDRLTHQNYNFLHETWDKLKGDH